MIKMPDDEADAIMQSMREHCIKRMQNADDAERRAMLAFQSGEFQSYWHKLGEEAEDRLDEARDELEQSTADAADTDTGSIGEGGGDGSGPGVSPDDRNSPSEPPAEELPPST